MSRTYRRKDGYGFEAYDFVWIDDECRSEKKYYASNTKEYKKAKSQFHRDGKSYGGSVPSWFVNILERSFRNKTKKELYKWIKNESYEVMAPEFRHDAGYTYW